MRGLESIIYTVVVVWNYDLAGIHIALIGPAPDGYTSWHRRNRIELCQLEKFKLFG